MSLRGRALAGLTWIVLGAGCAQVLGFEDHELGSIDPASGGSSIGATGGSSGSGAAPAAGMGGSSGVGGSGGSSGGSGGSMQGGSGGTGESGSGGAAGDGATAGMGGGGSGAGGTGGGGTGGTGGACALCAAGAALVHRYSFDGSSTEATDSVGADHGTIVGTTLSGSGDVVLSGTDQYVNLPNGIVSELVDATFEVWVTWTGTAAWQRIFDFGSETNGVEDMQGNGDQYLFLSPRAVGASGTMRVAYSTAGSGGEVVVNAPTALGAALSHAAVVISGTTLYLYRNGAVEGFAGPIGPLSAINDINNWLGRSQYSSDTEFAGTIHEFRVYGAALTAAQIGETFAAGPDATFPPP